MGSNGAANQAAYSTAQHLAAAAGAAILLNPYTFHAGNVRNTTAERRTIHLYCGRSTDGPLSNHTIFPPRLWRGKDEATRRYYSRPNAYHGAGDGELQLTEFRSGLCNRAKVQFTHRESRGDGYPIDITTRIQILVIGPLDRGYSFQTSIGTACRSPLYFDTMATDTTEPSRAVTAEKVDAAIERIVRECSPRRLVLFGSFVLGQTDRNSDLDVLVVTEDEVENPRLESVRIRSALRGISMPIDILVVSESKLNELADAPGLIYREALRNGKVVYESG